MYKPHKDRGRMHKAESRWRDGIWLGFNTRTGEHIVSDDGGAVSCRTIHRRPPAQMWDKGLALKVIGTPWNLKGGDAVVDRDVAIGRGVLPMREPTVAPSAVAVRYELPAGKRVYITKQMVAAFGATLGCRGCLEVGVVNT